MGQESQPRRGTHCKGLPTASSCSRTWRRVSGGTRGTGSETKQALHAQLPVLATSDRASCRRTHQVPLVCVSIHALVPLPARSHGDHVDAVGEHRGAHAVSRAGDPGGAQQYSAQVVEAERFGERAEDRRAQQARSCSIKASPLRSGPPGYAALTRKAEMDAYTLTLAAFFAQGELTWQKEGILGDLRQMLRISEEHHQREIQRIWANPSLCALARIQNGGREYGSALAPSSCPASPLTRLQ